MSGIKMALKTNPVTSHIYAQAKNARDAYRRRNNLKYDGIFVDRSKKSECLLLVLAGYKEFLYPAVFGRIKDSQKPDMDICIISSGKYSAVLDTMCEKNGWSYLSTKQNNVCLVQNVAIAKHPAAKYIFKLDEDVFIPADYFDRMLKSYLHAQNGRYNVGVLAPMLTINGFSSPLIIEEMNLKNEYEKRFGLLKYATGPKTQIESNPEFAKFMWGDVVPLLDEMDKKCREKDMDEIPCPYRFSIGAILFERSLWEEMGYWTVKRNSTGMGADEVELDTFCFLNSRPLMVTKNVVAGHLSFGKQNATMKKYYESHRDVFYRADNHISL